MFKAMCSAVAIATLLAGCQATPLQAPTLAAVAPQTIADGQVRRLLSVEGGAGLWGINYSLYRAKGSYKHSWYEVNWAGRLRKRTETIRYDDYHGNANFAGKSELLKASYDRYVYRVPDDQVLVLNQTEGTGTIYLNGFAVRVSDTVRPVHYMFGPGEELVIRFVPDIQLKSGDSSRSSSHYVYNYHSLHISGFTTSPNLLGSIGASTGSVK